MPSLILGGRGRSYFYGTKPCGNCRKNAENKRSIPWSRKWVHTWIWYIKHSLQSVVMAPCTLQMSSSRYQISKATEERCVRGEEQLPSHAGPSGVRREMLHSLFLEAKTNVLVWLVLARAGSKEEEHWKVKNESWDLCLVLMQMKVKLYKQQHNWAIHHSFISSFSSQHPHQRKKKNSLLFIKDQEDWKEGLIGEHAPCALL